MNRSELTAAVAEQAGLTTQQAGAAVAATLDAITKAVASGDSVAVPGFGTFEPRQRSARTGRNPQTGEAMDIPASVAPAFKPASAFKKLVSEG